MSNASLKSTYLHPRDELVDVMSRLYGRHLTTSSGGNASIMDAEGVVWMTPKGNDKGALKREEMAFRSKNGEWEGDFPPSSEWPFHTRIYEARPDIKAVLHAHSQTLVAFSVANQLPNTLSLSQAANLCGEVGLAPYAMPGTDALADSIVEQIKTHDCVIMANHGVVVVGVNMMEAYQKFEALEFCARAEARARVLGSNKSWTQLLLTPKDMAAQAEAAQAVTVETNGRPPVTPTECDLRASLVKFVRRAYVQGLVHSTSGAMSARLTPTSFLITPSAVDRHSIEPEDIVLVDFTSMAQAKVGRGARFYAAPGLVPSRAWAVHNALYHAFPDTHAVLHAQPFHIAAFCMSSANFSSNIIPESYIVLRNVGRILFRHSLDGAAVVDGFKQNENCNVVLVDNDGVMIKGSSLAQVFDRLEVLEATANVVLECTSLGHLQPMTKEQIEEIDEKWFKKEPNANKKRKTGEYTTTDVYGK